MILTSTQVSHFSRWFRQKLVLPKVAIIGGYHGGNLGDMALGMAIKSVLTEKGVSNGLQTIYNLERWPEVPLAIVGGGAVGYIDSLLRVCSRYRGNFAKLGLLGVDFNEVSYPEGILKMIQEAAFVSCRSAEQAARLMSITGRKIVYHHPDIAFSLLNDYCSKARERRKDRQKKLFVNVLPIYGNLNEKGNVEPNINYKSERPELYRDFEFMQDNYKKAIRRAVEHALQEGYSVECIPFTPADRSYCMIMLKDLPVKFPAYHSDPVRMVEYLSGGSRMISTRFHATIFGLKAGLNIQPVAYATKNELMLKELGLSRDSYLSASDLASGLDELPKGTDGYDEIVRTWETESKQIIVECINSVIING